MPYDESLADRIRPLMSRRKGATERKMFGGVGFLLFGNMCCGVWKKSLIVRIGPKAYAKTLAEPFVREFDITGRPMKGWVLVEPDGTADDDDLKNWITRAAKFAGSLPRK